MIKTINDLNKVCYDRWSDLNSIDHNYLSDAGKAAMEAYKAAIWYFAFHDTMNSLSHDSEFMNLVNIEGKHPEYYRILRKINRAVSKAVLFENQQEGN